MICAYFKTIVQPRLAFIQCFYLCSSSKVHNYKLCLAEHNLERTSMFRYITRIYEFVTVNSSVTLELVVITSIFVHGRTQPSTVYKYGPKLLTMKIKSCISFRINFLPSIMNVSSVIRNFFHLLFCVFFHCSTLLT